MYSKTQHTLFHKQKVWYMYSVYKLRWNRSNIGISCSFVVCVCADEYSNFNDKWGYRSTTWSLQMFVFIWSQTCSLLSWSIGISLCEHPISSCQMLHAIGMFNQELPIDWTMTPIHVEKKEHTCLPYFL